MAKDLCNQQSPTGTQPEAPATPLVAIARLLGRKAARDLIVGKAPTENAPNSNVRRLGPDLASSKDHDDDSKQ